MGCILLVYLVLGQLPTVVFIPRLGSSEFLVEKCSPNVDSESYWDTTRPKRKRGLGFCIPLKIRRKHSKYLKIRNWLWCFLDYTFLLTFQSLTDELRQDSPSAMNSPLPAVPGCPACHPPRFSTSPNGVAPHTGLRKLPESPRMAQVRNSDAISSKILVQLTYGLAPN